MLAIKNSDLIILCIKPQNFKIVANEIYGKITNDQTIVSIMAGININTISKAISTMKIIRIMPNTPAQIGKGISAWNSTLQVSKESKLAVKEILGVLGDEIEFKEEKYKRKWSSIRFFIYRVSRKSRQGNRATERQNKTVSFKNNFWERRTLK